MESGHPAAAGCPWFARYSRAAYSPSAVAALIGGRDGFQSAALSRLYVRRAGFAFHIGETARPARLDERDARLLAALLGKLAGRGLPAPCSLSVERHVLVKAARADVLDFEERTDSGQFLFRCRPHLRGLSRLLTACLWPELLLDQTEAALVADNMRSLCQGPQRDLFDRIVERLGDERLALFVTPGRRLLSMLPHSRSRPTSFDEQVDLSVELVSPDSQRVERLAVILDTGISVCEQPVSVEDRVAALVEGGWTVMRVSDPASPDAHAAIEAIERAIRTAVPDWLVRASDELRLLPDEQRRAIEDLVVLPAAEAQLTALVAEVLARFRSADLLLANPLHLDLGPVVAAVGEAVKAFRAIHRLPDPGRLRLAFTGEFADAVYFGLPSIDAWEAMAAGFSSVVAPTVVAEGYVPPLSGAEPRAVDVRAADAAGERAAGLLYLLQNVFRKVAFRPGQVEIIERALALEPVVGVLPTAAGKSLCYQLASLAQPGFTIVVDPLAALMEDQRDNLRAFGIHRTTAIPHAMLVREDSPERAGRQPAIEAGEHLFVFVAPERLQLPDFRDYIQGFSAYVPVTYCVIDEAHCVSEWGHDFRLSYLNVAPLLSRYCQRHGRRPSLIALTGTASRNVIVDILRELEMTDPDALVRARNFDRPELEFEVYQVPAAERLTVLGGKMRSVLDEFGWQPGQPGEVPSGLVFAYSADDELVGAEATAADLSRRLRLPVPVFSDTPPREYDNDLASWEERKIRVQRQFKRNELPVLVCTAGFGMGIDKPSIRFTVHTTLPRSLEEFYQQAGRAGRDRQRGRCLVLFADDQPRIADALLDTERTSLEQIAALAADTPREARSDAVRNVFHQAAHFLGREVEERLLEYLVTEVVGPAAARAGGEATVVEVPYVTLPVDLLREGGASSRLSYEFRVGALEKMLYRLLMVGAIADYLNDFGRRQFLVVIDQATAAHVRAALEAYLRRYATEGDLQAFLPAERFDRYDQAVLACGRALIRYLYATVEKRRRRAIGQMLQSARDGVALGAGVFREHLLAYLEESEFTRPVAEMAAGRAPGRWFEVLGSVEGLDGLTKLLGACRRELEESPSHAGLLLVAGVCRLACVGADEGAQDLRNGFAALVRELPDAGDRVEVARQLIRHLERLAPSHRDAALNAMLRGDGSREMTRFCYAEATTDSPIHHEAILALAAELAAVLTTGRDTHERTGAQSGNPQS